jgi:TPR repeat protein
MATKIDSLLLDRRIAQAAMGDEHLAYDLGVAYSTGTSGAEMDPVEAHKWFNLAAVWGNEEAKAARADISEDMTAREIATAQRAARDILAMMQRRAA